MRKMKSLVFSSILLLVISMMMSSLTIMPVTAKNLNLPDGANNINYYNAGGQAEVALPAGMAGFPTSATGMRFSVVHVEIPNSDTSFDSLLVWMYVKPTGFPLGWYPFAIIISNANTEQVELLHNYWAGSFVNLDATKYFMNPPANTIPFPANYGTDNVIVVEPGVLTVDRHGNSITVNLKEQQQFKRPFTTGTNLPIPAFTLELKAQGESIHGTETHAIVGIPGASRYTLVNEYMGFGATGTITGEGYLNGPAVNNAMVAMHGTHTYYPPA
jgi:hypothetical protein